MKDLQEDILAVKQILQESCDQCCQGAFCITYFKRLKGTISNQNQEQVDVILNTIVEENIQNIKKKELDNSWLTYELDNTFPTESKIIHLAKILTTTIVDNNLKDKVMIKDIQEAIPKWLSKNDRDLTLGSIIQFLFYLDNYVSTESEI